MRKKGMKRKTVKRKTMKGRDKNKKKKMMMKMKKSTGATVRTLKNFVDGEDIEGVEE